MIKSEIRIKIPEEILLRNAPLFKKFLTKEFPTIIEINVYQKKSIIEAMPANINLSKKLSSLVIN